MFLEAGNCGLVVSNQSVWSMITEVTTHCSLFDKQPSSWLFITYTDGLTFAPCLTLLRNVTYTVHSDYEGLQVYCFWQRKHVYEEGHHCGPIVYNYSLNQVFPSFSSICPLTLIFSRTCDIFHWGLSPLDTSHIHR